MEEGISISQTQWIKRVDLDKSESTLEIDQFMGSFKDLLNRLEVHCDAGCCGVDAFSFWKEDIQSVSAKMDKKSIVEDAKKLKAIIQDSEATTLQSARLNETFHQAVFIQLLNHIIASIEE